MDAEKSIFASTLRMFLSVDIIGSTALKQTRQRKALDGADDISRIAEPWFSPIAQFYRGVAEEFSLSWGSVSKKYAASDWPGGDPPELWKSIGDELVFVKVLADHRQALITIVAWISAIRAFREKFRAKFPSLDLKCTAWIAGFPVHNQEVVFSSQMGVEELGVAQADPVLSNLFLLDKFYREPTSRMWTRDFIGPAIDTGFRLCQFSSSRKTVVSVDLAILLVNSIRLHPQGVQCDVDFHYDGRHSLKGVFGGIAYPIFWIDMRADPELEKAEDHLNSRSPMSTDRLKAFCEAFITSNRAHTFMPYIVNNPEPYFKTIPQEHQERLDVLEEFWRDEKERVFGEVKSGKAKTNIETGRDESDKDAGLNDRQKVLENIAMWTTFSQLLSERLTEKRRGNDTSEDAKD